MNIAIIAPIEKDDYLLNDVLDGLFQLNEADPKLTVRISTGFIHPFQKEKIHEIKLPEKEFIDFAQKADIIILAQRKGGTNFDLAEKIGKWDKTVFLDGSELGKNRRFDHAIQNEVVLGRYKENGGVNMEILKKCAAYFRREKPYLPGIIPFPYSIQSSYMKKFNLEQKKDIDFVCIFGQEEFPPMRKYAREILEEYCKKEGFTFRTEKTKGFDFSLERTAGRDEFYEVLARAKVGISIGGGGFDTVRFWETLGNNCLIITETIDIFQKDSKELDYSRIYEFNNLYDFKYQLEKVGKLLRSGYDQKNLEGEYQKILVDHSSKTRAEKLISISLDSIKTKKEMREENKKVAECAIVISSCDKYSDLWEPFFTLFFRYWPDCPFPIYLVSDSKTFTHDNVTMIHYGADKGWAANTKYAFSKIPQSLVIYLQEDYFLQSRVNTQKIEDLIKYVAANPIASIRLIGLPDPKFPHNNPFGLKEIKKEEKYRVSLQGALWKKDIYTSLMKDGETGWDMEEKGTVRSEQIPETFLSAQKKYPLLDYYYYTGIKRGKWMPGALRLLKRENISVDLTGPSARGVHSDIKIIRGRIKNFLSNLRRGKI